MNVREAMCPRFEAAMKILGKRWTGLVIQVLATDPGSMADFEAWTRSTGHDLVEAAQETDRYTFLIRRTR